MRYDPDIHHRRSIRLRGFDYTRARAYFVTVCVQNRECVLGEVDDATVCLSEAGQAVVSVWQSLPERFANVTLDAFVIMPNHLHGIIVLQSFDAEGQKTATQNGAKTASLSEIVRVLKAAATHAIRSSGMPFFQWQRNYYEHIVRDDQDMERIRAYITHNPMNWSTDAENPAV